MDTVQALHEEVTLDELTEQVADARGEALSAGDREAARARAREIINTARGGSAAPDSNPLAGAQDMHALSLSIGMPVPRTLFAEMTERSGASPGKKRGLLRDVGTLSEITETGCIKADFYDKVSKTPRVAFLLFEPCDADHDLGAQLDKLYARIDTDKQDEIRKHLSMLLYIGRSVYGQMLVQRQDLLDKITKKLPDGFDPRVVHVDPSNTTLYLSPPCEKRVGIFVRLDDEVPQAVSGRPGDLPR